jgi:hypothetical protein
MRTVLFAVVLAVVTGANRPERDPKGPTPSEAEIKVGYYRCRGESADGTAYSCLAAVRRVGKTYAVAYYGDALLLAVGVRQGDVLSIGFGSARQNGVAVYRVLPGRLEGVTAALPTKDGAHGKETLTYFAPFADDEDLPGD